MEAIHTFTNGNSFSTVQTEVVNLATITRPEVYVFFQYAVKLRCRSKMLQLFWHFFLLSQLVLTTPCLRVLQVYVHVESHQMTDVDKEDLGWSQDSASRASMKNTSEV